MDTLIKLFRARGHEFNIGQDESHVVVFGESFVFRLQEKLRYEYVIEGRYNWKTRHEYPTGIFMFRCWKTFYWHQKVWSDSKVLIENQLAKIVAEIELLALKEKAERIKMEEQWKIERERQLIEIERQRIEKERHDREELDGANFQKLLEQSKKWKQAQILYEYIKAIEDNAILSGGISDELKDWLIWAKEKAEKFNPINNH